LQHPQFPNSRDPISVMDLPGLVEDAHVLSALSVRFLRHLSGTKALCYVVDLQAQKAGQDPFSCYKWLRAEVMKNREKILVKPISFFFFLSDWVF
jgi:GTPase involved in cell partitioning and DNA repair